MRPGRLAAGATAALAFVLATTATALAAASPAAQSATAASAAVSTPRIPDTSPPPRLVQPLYPVRNDLERLQLVGRADSETAAAGLERLLAAHTAPDLMRLEALATLAGHYAYLDNDADWDRTLHAVDALGERLPAARIVAMVARASALRRHKEPGKAERLLIEASALMGPDTPAFVRLQWLTTSAAVKRYESQFDESLRRYHEAMTLVERADLAPWRAVDLRSNLASLLDDAGQTDKALEILADLERQATTLHDEEALSSVFNARASMLDGVKDGDRVKASWEAAVEHSRLAGDRHAVVLNLADLADYYLQHGDYPTAYEVSQRALPLARELHDRDSQSVALGNIGLSLIAMHRKDEGMRWMREAQALDDRSANLSEIARNTLEMGSYLEKAGYLSDALAAYRQYRQLEADAGVQDQQHAVLELQETFANEQRQHELDMLSREGRLKDEELRHHDLEVKEWTAAGIASLLMALVLVTLARRLRVRNQQLSASNEALRIQAERDPLTGLANRHFLQATLAARASARGLEGTLYLLDVDHFKHINDRCGHAGGDAVLIEIAHRLRETLRGDDLIVRWGGEEFLVLVKPMPIGEAEALAQRLLTALAEKPAEHEGHVVPLSCSIGYGQFPLPGSDTPVDWERAISLVDTAMYLSKAHGRNCACGIRRVDPVSGAQLDVLAQTLEAAWREGRAELHLQYGPEVEKSAPPRAADGRAREAAAPSSSSSSSSPSSRETVQ